MLRITESSFVEDNSIVSKVPCVPGGFCWALSIEQINTELNVNAVNMVIRYSPVCSFGIHNRMPSKICLRMSQVANQAGAYLWFWNMKWLGVFLPPTPGWDASPSQGYPQHWNSPAPICTPGWKEALWELSVNTMARTRTAHHEAFAPPCHRFVVEGLKQEFF